MSLIELIFLAVDYISSKMILKLQNILNYKNISKGLIKSYVQISVIIYAKYFPFKRFRNV